MSVRLVVCLPILFLLQTSGCSLAQDVVMQRNLDRIEAGNRPEWLKDDAIHVVLCGTGSPLLDLERAGPCTAVIAGGKLYLVDAGVGSTERSLQYQLPLAQLDGVFVTHFHSDHIAEVGEAMTQSWIAGRATPLDIYGPAGVEEVVDGFTKVYARDQIYRTAHHTQEFMPKEGAEMRARLVAPSGGRDALVLDRNGLKVYAIEVDHAPVAPAVGYRFEFAGRSVVVSGDTNVSENLGRASKGADLLIHEALEKKLVATMSGELKKRNLNRLARLSGDILDYHTSPEDAMRVAREAGVGTLVFTHIVPAVPPIVARRVFFQDLGDRGDTDVVLGADGLHFRIAPDGSVEQDDLN